ncbi:flavin monoamine oxidase family protein [Nocardia sp. NPDC059239]|uniref:flavin monoamine oxidase family protein n=1 Tax=unclassified Nocardia TaxID=2637762 RepID=UPI0036A656AC
MPQDYDVIVIGAGFAGATTARECATLGLRTLVLEARDRVGGRTWTSELSDGELIEIGGTYVHWLQPHTWSEISRYGLDAAIEPAVREVPEQLLAPSGANLVWHDFEDHAGRQKELFERFFEQSMEVVPRPYDPLYAGDAVAEFDKLSIRDRLDQLNLAPDDYAYLAGVFGGESGVDVSEASFLTMLRWWSLAGHNHGAFEEALFGYKLTGGTVGLLNAIISDGGAELRLNEVVTTVVNGDDGVTVSTAGGGAYSAKVAVVATPSGIWPRIGFAPALAAERVEAAREGMQVPRGSKIIAVIRGESRRFYVQPHPGHPIGFMWTNHLRSADEQVVTIFGTPALKDATDPDEVAAAVKSLLPDVEIVEAVTGTYLDDDEFAGGGWPFPKRGQLTRFAPYKKFAEPEGRLVFATSDIAAGWCGFIDGAIESGYRAARNVRTVLQAGSE